MIKKLFCFGIVFFILFSMTVIPVSAEITEGCFTYEITGEKKAVITGVDNEISGDVVIPSATNSGYPVIGICTQAFDSCRSDFNLSLPKTLEWIEGYAFARCPSVSLSLDSENPYFTLVDGILYSADMTTLVYASPKLTGNFVTPDSVTTVCDGAFVYSQFESITISDNVTTMMTPAYTYSGIWDDENCGRVFANALCKHITIGRNVEELGRCCVYQCPNLEDFTVLGMYTEFIDSGVILYSGYSEFGYGGNTGTGIPAKLYFYKNSYAEEYAQGYEGEWEYLASQKLPQPTNLTWNEEFNGELSWDSPEGYDCVFGVKIYRDGELIYETESGMCEPGRNSMFMFFDDVFNQTGDYTFSLITLGDGGEYIDSEPVTSDVYHFILPEKKLETPTELQWLENCILKHKAVPNASGYNYRFYNQDKDSLWTLATISLYPTENLTGYEEKDLSDAISSIYDWYEDIEELYVTVTALTNNIEEYLASDESAFFAVYKPENSNSDEPEFLCGDVNGDEKVTLKDDAFLARYLAHWTGYDETTVNLAAADVNADGNVTVKDNAILARHLAKWIGYESLPYLQ